MIRHGELLYYFSIVSTHRREGKSYIALPIALKAAAGRVVFNVVFGIGIATRY